MYLFSLWYHFKQFFGGNILDFQKQNVKLSGPVILREISKHFYPNLDYPKWTSKIPKPCSQPLENHVSNNRNSSIWQLGPYIPVAACCGGLVEDPRGGVILVGGKTASGLTTSLYRLKCGGLNGQWELMTQKLKLGIQNFATFIIPDILVQNCTLT
jgi:hypothetical protein